MEGNTAESDEQNSFEQESAATTDSPSVDCDDCRTYTRRDAMRIGAVSAVALTAGAASSGSAAAQETATDTAEEVTPDFESDYVHNPWINAAITVEDVLEGYTTLDYTDDNGEQASLADRGYVLAAEPDSDDTPHNPISLTASGFYTTDDDGNRQRHPEFAGFPRGASYDDDADSATDEVDVSVLDATHWTTTNATNGSITVADASNGALQVSTSGVASGETVTATFDLSSVASDDQTITSGVARKFLQTVVDVDALPAGVLVEVALVASDGATEVVGTIDPSGDVSTTKVMLDSTGDAQGAQVRIGELETDQSVDMPDVQQVQVRVSEADADLTFHGLNVERESEWVFGTQEQQTTNDDGETVVETVEVTEPSGTYGVTDLSTLDSTPFSDAAIASVEYDVEARAGAVEDANVHARLKSTPDTYDYGHELETVVEFEAASAYSLSVSHENMLDEVKLPSSRMVSAEVATGAADIEDWDDVEETISWTDRTSSYGSVGNEVELYSSVSSAERTISRHRVMIREDEVSAATESGAVVGVAAGGGSGGGFDYAITLVMAGLTGLAAFFRNDIIGLFRS